MNAVRTIQRRIVADYAGDLGLQTPAHYYGGARLRPLPPLDTATGGVMIVGAYPSARFETVGRLRAVPVGDNLGPFERERYFDGTSVRSQKSANELKQKYLEPLGLEPNECWITDLVKVFLFKPGHRAKYAKLGTQVPSGYERERLEAIGEASLPWLAREIGACQPRLIITLGAEVAGVVRGVSGTKARNGLLGQKPLAVSIGGSPAVPVVHLAHPGIVMRPASERNPWPHRHANEHIPALRDALTGL